MVGMVIAAVKPTFNVDSLARAVLSVGGTPAGPRGWYPATAQRGEMKRFYKVVQKPWHEGLAWSVCCHGLRVSSISRSGFKQPRPATITQRHA